MGRGGCATVAIVVVIINPQAQHPYYTYQCCPLALKPQNPKNQCVTTTTTMTIITTTTPKHKRRMPYYFLRSHVRPLILKRDDLQTVTLFHCNSLGTS